MDSTIIDETQAFITRQRDALLAQREAIFTQQQALQTQLDSLNAMLAKFDVFEGKARPASSSSRAAKGTGARGPRAGSKREELLAVIRAGNGMSRGEILDKMGLKGNKAGEMSVSNALTALTKADEVRRENGKYLAA
jgi:hypothetical protein